MAVVAAGCGALWAAASDALARPLADAERTALNTTVSEFTDALRSGDFDALIDSMPRPFLEQIATVNQMSVDAIEAAMREATAELASGLRFESLELAGDDFQDFAESPDGLLWGVAPTEFEVVFRDQRYRVASNVLALRDGAEWHLMRIEALSTHELLVQAYPGLSALPFAPEVVTPLE